MKRVLLRHLLLGLTSLALVLTAVQRTAKRVDPPPKAPPTIEQIQTLAELVTLKVEVADIHETKLCGFIGSSTAAILIKGEVWLAVDLSGGSFAGVDADSHSAVLALPQPHVSSSRLDHARTRLFAVYERGLWQMVPGDDAQTAVLNRAFREAQDVVGRVGQSPQLIDRAKRQAEKVLTTYFQAIGWRIKILWADR